MAAVVLLAVGIVVAVAAPIVGGDGFLPSAGSDMGVFTGSNANWRASQGDGPSFAPSFGSGVPIELWVRAAHNDPREDFVGLVASDPRWIAATVALVAIPLWFLWWRRSAMSFARGIGVLASAATTAALLALTWPASEFCPARVLIAAPVAYLATFLVAPPPRVPDTE